MRFQTGVTYEFGMLLGDFFFRSKKNNTKFLLFLIRINFEVVAQVVEIQRYGSAVATTFEVIADFPNAF